MKKIVKWKSEMENKDLKMNNEKSEIMSARDKVVRLEKT